MADGRLVKTLIHTKVSESLNFQVIDGSYVYKGGKVYQVPCTYSNLLSTSLVGFLEKRRFRNFLDDVSNYYENMTHIKYNSISKQTAFDYMRSFNLDPSTMTFIGHAIAFEPDDTYLKKSAKDLIYKVRLYINSSNKFKNQNSPYLYPMYGFGDLPQAFDRLCSAHGGTFMLNKQIDDFIWEGNKVVGIKYDSQQAIAPIIIGNPSYFTKINGKLKNNGKIVRAYCIINHPVSCIKNKLNSASIVIPQLEVGRKHDIYVCFTSFKQRVCPDGWYFVFVSTYVETSNPEAELKPGLDLLGPVAYMKVLVSNFYESCVPGSQDNIYCSSSYDPTTNFESTLDEVLNLYEEIMGEPVIFSKEK